MYVLHYAPDNASMIVRIVLEEAVLPYRPALVDRRIRAQDSAAYRRLNPAGLIPTLETPDGPISETGAILLWLADRHPEAGLAPAPQAPRRGDFLRWLFFLSNTAHADLRQVFYPAQYADDAGRVGHRALMVARMQRHFRLLDDAGADSPDLFTPPSVLAPYVAALMRWSVIYPRGQAGWFDAAAYPSLMRVAAALESRPAVRTVARAEGLGDAPFSAPVPTRPPEGSST
ncbi:MAG: glutathione S-transferase family protein [Paracoccaceae bacterium]|nr:MAG: glutathione S-transferase family protein [Paracoccaceae bacterium]